MSLSRKQSREVAYKLLFALAFDKQADVLSDEALVLALDNFATIQNPEKEYIKKICTVVQTNIDAIDKLIAQNSKDFSFDRIFQADLTALRLGVGEILFMEETPNIVAVDEAVTLAKKYSTEKSGVYVNGVLAVILKEVLNEC